MPFDPKGAGTKALQAVHQILTEAGLTPSHIEVIYDGVEMGDEPNFFYGLSVHPSDAEHTHCHAHNLATGITTFVPVAEDGSGALLMHFATDSSVHIGVVDLGHFSGDSDEEETT